MMLRQIGFRRILPGLVAPNLEQRFFGAGEQGGVYLFDKAHQGGLFQDAAFTTPVTAVEQYVGSFLDWSGNGNHCAQTTSTARSKWSARVNLLGNSKTTFTAYGTTPPLVNNSATFAGEPCTSVKFTPASSVGYAGSRATGAHSANYQINIPYISGFRVALSRVLVPGELITLYFTGSYGFPPIQLTHVNSVGLVDAPTFMRSAIGVANTVSSVVLPNIFLGDTLLSDLEVYIFDSEFLLSSNAYLPHQRVTSATDYDTAGFPHYLSFDGADDYYASIGNIDFTGTDKMTALVAHTVGANTVNQVLLELGPSGETTPGTFSIAPRYSSDYMFFSSLGYLANARAAATIARALNSPIVSSLQADLSGVNMADRLITAVDSTAGVTGGVPSGGSGGNFANSQLFLGARNKTSFFFTGRVYGAIVRGAVSSAAELSFAKRYLANLQGRAL
jgi:hypothetical protein